MLKRKLTLTVAIFLAVHSAALSASCITDASKFDFMITSGQIFYFGKEEEVRRIYTQLEEHIENPTIYGQTKLFYAQGGFKRLFTSNCAEKKCTGMDILEGLQNCSSEAPDASSKNVCHPLAAVYDGKVYCLLAPALDNYSSVKPFQPFNPYGEDRK